LALELNPYYKNGGNGVPTEEVEEEDKRNYSVTSI